MCADMSCTSAWRSESFIRKLVSRLATVASEHGKGSSRRPATSSGSGRKCKCIRGAGSSRQASDPGLHGFDITLVSRFRPLGISKDAPCYFLLASAHACCLQIASMMCSSFVIGRGNPVADRKTVLKIRESTIRWRPRRWWPCISTGGTRGAG